MRKIHLICWYFLFPLGNLFSLEDGGSREYYNYRVEQMNKIFGTKTLSYPFEEIHNRVEWTKKIFTYYLDELQCKKFSAEYDFIKTLYKKGLLGQYLSQEFSEFPYLASAPLSKKDWKEFIRDFSKKTSSPQLEKKWGGKIENFSQEIVHDLLSQKNLSQLLDLGDEKLYKLFQDSIQKKIE